MELKEFIANLNKSHFFLTVENGKLNLTGDKTKLSKDEILAIRNNNEIIGFIKEHRDELINYISANSTSSALKNTKDVSSIYKLSGLQEGMLFHSLYETITEAHKVQFKCDLIGLNADVFKQTWSYVLKHHTILRSGFYYDSFSIPVQSVYNNVQLPFVVLDYRGKNAAEQSRDLKAFEAADIARPFDFKTPPLMRVTLLHLSDNRYRLIWTSHHILFDGWSFSIILEELLNTYEALLKGDTVSAKEEDRYEDYIRYIERSDKKEEEKKYWSDYLKKIRQSTLLPFVNTFGERNKGAGNYKSLSLELDEGSTARVQNYAQRNRLTVNTVIQGAWSYLLHRYTNSESIVYGVVVSGRPEDLPNIERRVGMYINTLPLCTIVNSEQQIKEWLANLQAEQVASRQFQHTPLQQAQRYTGIQGDLFDSLLVFENYPVSKVISAKKWSLGIENVHTHDPTIYPLTILINNSKTLHVDFHYNASLLSESYLKDIRSHFENVLLQIANSAEGKIKDINLLNRAQEQELLNDFNNTVTEYANDKSIIDLFEEQVSKTPESIAVSFDNKEISYKDLNNKANQLARYLQSKGLQKKALVPICIERSIEMIIGVLGILKAGGTYVPIDPEYPEERISYMLNDLDAAIAISSNIARSKLSVKANIDIILLDTDWIQISKQESENLDVVVEPDYLAYVLYTSGSTGIPKGVKMPGGGLVNLLQWQEKQFDSNKRNVLQFASLNFDVSFQEIFSTLCFGNTLHLIAEDDRKDMSELLRHIGQKGISHLFIPYIVLKSLAEFALSSDEEKLSLRNIIVAGEQLKLTEDIQAFLDKDEIILINQYGPTEAHVVSSYTVTENYISQPLPPIGKPIDNIQLYILDANNRLSPKGVAGELYIGGVQVAEGYLNRPELTKEKFLQNPFKEDPTERLYKTGDLARWLPDGNLEYLGRIDEQVKIRGYRIELGEIEAVLQQSGLVNHTVVVAKDDEGSKQLVGYVVAETGFDKAAAISFLKGRLPEYMVPALWVELESLPISPNGKVDKKALPAVDLAGQHTHQYEAPRNETEQKLAEIWQEVLGVDKVGIQDNFFELGGHSILAMQVISSLRRKLKLEAGIKELFINPTIASFSEGLVNNTNHSLQPTIKVVSPRPTHIPLSFSQERLYFIDQLEGTVAYHIPAVFRLKGNLNIEALSNSFKKIIERHESLRTVIKEHGGHQYQHIVGASDWSLNVINGFSEEKFTTLQAQTESLINRPFDLSKDYMVRADLIRQSDEDNVLVVTMHHIASDGWSLSIIVKEVVELYKSFIEQRSANLDALPIQYADYAIWQRAFLQGMVLQQKLSYWKEKLSNVTPLSLPTDFARPVMQSTKGEVVFFSIERMQLQKLHFFSREHGATLFMTLLAAFKVLLFRYSGQEDICVGTPTANRTHTEVEGLIGFFLNTLALRDKVDGNVSFLKLLKQVKKTTLDGFENQEVPFEKVVETVVKDRDISRNALFQVMFILQNTPDIPLIQLGETELSTEVFENKTTKFDLTLVLKEIDDALQGTLSYNTDLFARETVQRMLNHFIELLSAVVKEPNQEISTISLVSESEKFKLLNEFNKPVGIDVEERNLVALFETQATLTPGNAALICDGKSLSYKLLNQLSNQLANFLAGKNVKQGSIVPVCTDRSFEMMIGVLAVLKTGAAYVPVDPEYPAERIAFMLGDTQAATILTSQNYLQKLQKIAEKVELIAIDSAWNELVDQQTENLSANITGEDLAYVLYTSGSTGKPKGVQIKHNSIAQHLIWFTKQYEITQADSSYLISSFSFDGAMTAIWPVLVKGGTLHLPVGNVLDPSDVLNYISQHSISYIKTLPGIFRELIHAHNFNDRILCKSVRLIILGGEKISSSDLKTYFSYYPNVIFSNHYGPTECTVSSSFYVINKENIEKFSEQPVVGRPVDYTEIYVLNEAGLLNPIGVPGEICISGLGVAKGYLNNETLTNEKFVRNPFSENTSSRMYKTGDIGRWHDDGNLQFIGRRDEQVKIRGYRVELGEIESVIRQSFMVRDAVVIAKEDNSGINNLVGYIVPGEGFNANAFQSYLRDELPGFMIPSIWVEMENLPLSPNGKVDRKALPEPHLSGQAKSKFQAPTNKTEQAIANIWQELLKVDQVGVYDNFFEIGGHSLLAMRVVSSIRKQLQVELTIKSLFLFPTIEGLAKHIQSHGQAVLLPVIKVQQRPERIPLSFSQERLWFIDRFDGSSQYHISAVLRLKGELNKEALQFALQNVVNRHEVLRTVIQEHEGQGYQYILQKDQFQIHCIDDKIYTEDREGLQKHIQQLISRPFRLSADHMLRADLIEIDNSEHLLVATMHHIASDGWSTSILVREVVSLYADCVEGKSSSLAPLQIQFADYAIWQRNYLQGDTLENELAYWKEKLDGAETLNLPLDYARQAVKTTKGAIAELKLDKELLNQLQSLSLQKGSTLFMTLLAAFKVLLYKYSGQRDVCVGTSISGRQQEEVESLIGFFVNTLPLRTSINVDASFTDLLQDVVTTTLGAQEHQQVPFEKVVEAVVKERDLSRNPLFDVLFILQNTPDIPALHFGDVDLCVESQEHVTAQFDITLRMKEHPDGLMIKAEYNTGLFSQHTLQRLLTHFNQIIKTVISNPSITVGEIQMLSEAEKHQLLIDFNDTETNYPKDKTIIDLFVEQVQTRPDAVAAVFEGKQLTFRELNEKSNQLAHYLRGRGVKAETLVPVCIDRSLEMIIGILAILKAGGAYVPIDPAYPHDRINHILEDTSATLVIVGKESKSQLPAKAGLEIIEIGEGVSLFQSQPSTNLTVNIQPFDVAYVIFTSGSTGKPKGAMNEHRGIYNRLLWAKEYFSFSGEDIILQKTPYTFDVSVWELLGSLISGCTLVFARPEGHKDNEYLKRIVKEQNVTVLHFVPSMLEVFLSDIEDGELKGLKKVLCSGEALKPSQVELFIKKLPHVELHNLYGPTEAAIDVTCWSLPKDIEKVELVPIGKPIENTQIFILDGQKSIVPIGISGEIHIGGVQVGRGYLKLPALTDERFIDDFFSKENGRKLYKSGDLARWLPDGNIEYLGRIDDQVKIRGYRIELGEIESVLQQSGLVNQSVVLAKEDAKGNKRLIGYVVSNDSFNQEEINRYLFQKLPDYMVPALWVQLESLPLTSNGKIDRKALPDPRVSGDGNQEYMAPRDETEQRLVEIWQELLGIEKVGIHDNFFKLGGHSILVMQVISSLRKKFKLEVSIKDFFANPTIAALAENILNTGIENFGQTEIKVVDPRPEIIPLSFNQERLWFIHQLEGSVEYHIPVILQLNGVLNPHALNYAVQNIVNRHEVLRTVYKEYKGQGYQHVLPKDGFRLQFENDLVFGSNTEKLQHHVRKLIKSPFDLSTDHMIRGTVLQLDENKHLLVVTLHHIASDGWSLSIIVKEVAELYDAYVVGRLPSLNALPIQYADFAIWQRDSLQEEVLEKKLNYWKVKLDNTAPLQLPTDYLRPNILSTKGGIVQFEIDKELTDRLRVLSHQQETTLFMTLLAAYKVLLHRHSGQEDICVGTAIAGRQKHEVESLIGFFINSLALRSELNAKDSFSDLLSKVKATTLEAYAHQEVPFEKVVDAVVKERDSSRSPLFQAVFLLQNVPDVPEVKFAGLELSGYDFKGNTAKSELIFQAIETGTGLKCAAQYATDIYGKITIEQLVDRYKELLYSIVKSPEQKIGSLSMSKTFGEPGKLSTTPVSAGAEFLWDKTMVDLFEEQVAKTPNAVALIFDDTKLSYQVLNEAVNKLAHYLITQGVEEETFVPICMDRSLELIISILGILKAGAAYVPIDPAYPEERIHFMLKDIGASIALSTKQLKYKLESSEDLAIITLDEEGPAISKMSTSNPSLDIDSNYLAYVIYTSGSTGKPKGVTIMHRSNINMSLDQVRQFNITPGDNVLQFASISFDASVSEIFMAFYAGATLVLMSKEKIQDTENFATNLRNAGVTVVTLPPVYLKALHADDLTFLRVIITAGEPADVKQAAYLSNFIDYYNAYGPTECSVCASIYKVSPDDASKSRIPIGKPIANTNIYILDEDKQELPAGMPGEIYISGVGLAKGYHKRRELTAEKFIANPFGTGKKLYKTGDAGRWLADGNLEFLGRKDDQVKIRGYRVEPGEIENTLLEKKEIQNCAVIIDGIDEDKQIIAYYQLKNEGEADKEELREFVTGKLPDYMIPSLFIEIAEFPVTLNGKIDKKALPKPNKELLADQYVAPRNEVEKTLVAIWQDVLKIDRVGINDNFFELGGHSLLAVRLKSVIREELKLELEVRAIFNFPTIAQLAEQIALKLQTGHEALNVVPAIEAQVRPAFIPLSYSQKGLWFIDRMEGSIPYNIPAILRLKGDLNREALQYALQTIVNRHEVLRTVYKENEGEPYQVILPQDALTIDFVDSAIYKNDKKGLQDFIGELIRKPFNLAKDHMLRASLLHLDLQDHVFVVTIHHIASDGWSLAIIVDEVAELYEAYTQSRSHNLAPLAIQYADFAIWQRHYLSGEVLERKLNYWKNKLQGVENLQFPTDYPRPAYWSSGGSIKRFSISKEVSDKLHLFSRQHETTMFMTLLAALKVLLHRYTGQQDICVGTSIAGRQQNEVEGLIGFFINLIAFRSNVDSNKSFVDFLQDVKATTLEAFENQEVPFEKVVDAVMKERGTSRHPISQVMLVLQNTPEVSNLTFGDVQLSREVYEGTTSQHDFILRLEETEKGLYGMLEFATDLYSEGTMLRFIDHFKQILASITSSYNERIADLPLLTEEEENKLLVDFNNNKADFPAGKTVIDLFEERVSDNPANTAIEFDEAHLSYAELNERSNQLARFLISRGITKETLVPICIERSLEMIVSILAVLKAGGAYIPVDPDYPFERISYMIEDSGAKIILSSQNTVAKLPSANDITVIEIDSLPSFVNSLSTDNLKVRIEPNNLAYVIYTSGTTGKPKGVMVEHKGLANLSLSQIEEFRLKPGMSTLQFASFGFDASCSEIFTSLLSGGSLVLPQKKDILSAEAFEELVNKHKIEVVTLPPSYQNIIKDRLGTIKTIVSAGEPLNEAVGRQIQSKGIRLINAYGPTENTVCVSLTDNPIEENRTTTIGKPLANVQVYILDKEDKLLPIGAIGEICVAGAQLARGYLNLPDLTAEKFIHNPFSTDPATKLYKTGDLGRWLQDGNIEYVGRIDDQVKVRGYRIEPGEIEAVLQQSGLVTQAVVMAKEDKEGNKRLVAYILADEAFDKQAVISYLERRLPEYMVPAIWVEMESFPVTVSGKVDKKELPNPDVSELVSDRYVAPRNEMEQKLAKIWQHLLELEEVGIYDNFFQLGGHSLLAIRLISSIRKELEVEVEIGEVFDYPTIFDLSARLEGMREGVSLPPIEKSKRPEYIPLSFSQERLWFLDQLEGSRHYHVPAVLRLKGDLSKEALQYAMQTIVNRHEVLRSVITEKEGQGYQHVLDQDTWHIEIIDDNNLKNDSAALVRFAEVSIGKPFNLAKDHMLRAHLIVLGPQEYILVATMHHIASDGWSLSILVKELVELYSAYTQNRPPNVVPLELQYADYAIWQRQHLEGKLESRLEYWKHKLEGVTPLQLPVDYARPLVQGNKGDVVNFTIEKDLSNGLQKLSHQQGSTMFMTLLAAFKVLLYKYSGQSDICVGTPIANRTQQELEGLIGFFINTLALRTNVEEDITFNELLQQVKTTTLEAYEHQDVPFEKVVDAVIKERNFSRNQLFQVMFILQNTPDVPKVSLGEVTLYTEESVHTTSIFDMTFYVRESSNGINCTVEYSTDLYSKETIEQFTHHYKNLLTSIVKTPNEKISELQILSEEEEHKLLVDFNDTYTAFPTGKTIVDLFEEQVDKTPAQIALVFGDLQLTYEELNQRANQLAYQLRNKGVIENTLVPICMERSVEMIAGILAILKAGGVYIPIDADYPVERIKYMLTDTAATWVLTSKEVSKKLFEIADLELIFADVLSNEANQPSHNLQINTSPKNAICITYTSGSTGKPKGVKITHEGIVNRLFWMWNSYPFEENERCAIKTSISFVDHMWELFGPLTKGITSVLFTREEVINLDILAKKLQDEKITRWVIVPSLLRALLDKLKSEGLTLPDLRYWTSSGETLSLDLMEEFYRVFPSSSHKLLNIYGSSEVTADVTCYDASEVFNAGNVAETSWYKKGSGSAPIGKPIANNQVYIVDKRGKLLPLGAWGEIYVGGVQVANGYLNATELTAKRFIADDFTKKPGATLFKTGDMARWLRDGNIEYQGRIDGQVKIRGYRIEPGEIENMLKQSDLVNDAIVLAKENNNGNNHLVGYVVPNGAFDKEAVTSYLKSHLPEYMVPAIWVELEKFPLLPNGKLNKKALPQPDVSALLKHQYVAPVTETEVKLAEVWQELLGLEQVGIYDNFFELGGHSILIMKMVSSIKKSFGLTVPIHVVFQLPNINSLSNYIDWEQNVVEDENSTEVEVINI